jgi:hypothetical protein
LTRLNEGRPKDQQYSDISIDDTNGDMTLLDSQGKPEVVPYNNNIFMNLALQGRIKPGTMSKDKEQKPSEFEVGVAMRQLNEFVNIDLKTADNRDGIDAMTRQQVISGLEAGLTFAEIIDGLALKRRATKDDVVAARENVQQLSNEVQRLKAQSTEWGPFPPRIPRVSESEREGIEAIELKLQEALQEEQNQRFISETPLDNINLSMFRRPTAGSRGPSSGQGTRAKSPYAWGAVAGGGIEGEEPSGETTGIGAPRGPAGVPTREIMTPAGAERVPMALPSGGIGAPPAAAPQSPPAPQGLTQGPAAGGFQMGGLQFQGGTVAPIPGHPQFSPGIINHLGRTNTPDAETTLLMSYQALKTPELFPEPALAEARANVQAYERWQKEKAPGRVGVPMPQ